MRCRFSYPTPRASGVADGDLFGHWRRHATDHGLLRSNGVPLQVAAAEFIAGNEWARPDGAEHDVAFESVCAFAQLASLVYAATAVREGIGLELAPLYGNSGLVGVARGDPILVRLLDDEDLRWAIFPHPGRSTPECAPAPSEVRTSGGTRCGPRFPDTRVGRGFTLPRRRCVP